MSRKGKFIKTESGTVIAWGRGGGGNREETANRHEGIFRDDGNIRTHDRDDGCTTL